MDSFFANADLHPLVVFLVIFVATILASLTLDMRAARARLVFAAVWIIALGGFFASAFFDAIDNLGLAVTEFAFVYSAVLLVKFLFRR